MNLETMLRRTALLLSLGLISITALGAQPLYKLRVDGLACPFCAYGVEKKLTAITGVQKVEVDIKTGNVLVTMVEGAMLDEATAAKAVKDAGFTLRSFGNIPINETGK